jgi:hypothetical protein
MILNNSHEILIMLFIAVLIKEIIVSSIILRRINE